MRQGGSIAGIGQQSHRVSCRSAAAADPESGTGGTVAIVNEQPTYFDDYAILRCTDLQECFEYLKHTLLE